METYYNPEDLAKFGTIGEKASELAEIMLAKIIEDYDYSESEIALMINGLGATPLMELYVFAGCIQKLLKAKRISAHS